MADGSSGGAGSRWLAAIQQAFGPSPTSRQIPGAPNAVAQALEPFLGHGVGHTFFTSGGGLDLLAADVGVEPGTIDLLAAEKVSYLVKPARLAFHYIDAAPEQSFLYLEAATLNPTGVYPGLHSELEEVVDLGGGRYEKRSLWDQGFWKYDHNGDEVPFPSGARIVSRVLGGSLLFVAHDSIWNRASGTYDGELQRMGESAILDAINGAVRGD